MDPGPEMMGFILEYIRQDPDPADIRNPVPLSSPFEP